MFNEEKLNLERFINLYMPKPTNIEEQKQFQIDICHYLFPKVKLKKNSELELFFANMNEAEIKRLKKVVDVFSENDENNKLYICSDIDPVQFANESDALRLYIYDNLDLKKHVKNYTSNLDNEKSTDLTTLINSQNPAILNDFFEKLNEDDILNVIKHALKFWSTEEIQKLLLINKVQNICKHNCELLISIMAQPNQDKVKLKLLWNVSSLENEQMQEIIETATQGRNPDLWSNLLDQEKFKAYIANNQQIYDYIANMEIEPASIIHDRKEQSLFKKNRGILSNLMLIPEIRKFINDKSLYQLAVEETVRNDNSIMASVSDVESSQSSLSSYENIAIGKLKTKYNKQIEDKGGLKAILIEISSYMEKQYNASPIEYNGAQLPVSMNELMELKKTKGWSEEEFKEIQKLYRMNPYHTVYRAVLGVELGSKFNPWWVEDQPHYGNPLEQLFRPNLQELTVLAWLATCDKEEYINGDISLDTCCETFTRELAYILRAHNWDKSRETIKNNKTINEQYDDLNSDQPSCGPGTHRMLFDAIRNNKLCVITTPTPTILEAHFKEFVRDNYINKFNSMANEELQSLSEKIQAYIDGDLELTHIENLFNSFNVDIEAQNKFYKFLLDKYGDSFCVTCAKFCNEQFLQNNLGPHIIDWSYKFGLHDILSKAISDKTQASSSLNHMHIGPSIILHTHDQGKLIDAIDPINTIYSELAFIKTCNNYLLQDQIDSLEEAISGYKRAIKVYEKNPTSFPTIKTSFPLKDPGVLHIELMQIPDIASTKDPLLQNIYSSYIILRASIDSLRDKIEGSNGMHQDIVNHLRKIEDIMQISQVISYENQQNTKFTKH